MFKRLFLASLLLLFLANAASANGGAVINEFVANHTGTDTHEYVEVFGLPGVDLSHLTILEIEGDGSGAGIVDGVFPVGTTNAEGLWVTNFMNNIIENGTMTLLLVESFTGTQGMDLDTDNDGAFDSTPWSNVVDGIAVIDAYGTNLAYTTVTIAAFFDGAPYTPGGASRIPNGTDTDAATDWMRNDFDGAGLPGFTGSPVVSEALNTPGGLNELVEPAGDPIINEFVANHTGADTHEFVEVLGDPNTGYSSFRILEIEGDAGANAGRVETIRTVGVTDADGYWVTSFMSGVLENGSMTLLLVENSTASVGLDLDTDDDGILDATPWSRIVDDVAVLNGDPSDHVYSSTVLTAGYDGDSYLPGGASRIPDGIDTDTAADWMRNDYDGDGLPGFTGSPESHEALNTPGEMNEEAIDVTPPVIVVDLNRTVLWPPNHKMVDIIATVQVTDNRDPSPTFTLVDVSSNEPDNGKGDGDTDDDIQGDDLGTADTAFQLRSERRGGGYGREYTIIYEATDAAGNTTQTTVAVRVPHDQRGMVMASDGFTPDGTDFDESAERFTVIIPSQGSISEVSPEGEIVLVSEAFDAAQIDAHHVYIGNSRGTIRADEVVVVDADHDGRDDIALYFSVEAVHALQAAITVEGVYDDRIEVARHVWKEYGSIGLHFEAPDGAEMKTDNIFELGAPVSITRGSEDYQPSSGEPAKLIEPPSIYPNPFNPSTAIRFELKEPARVVVRIFDVAGRLVETLADRTFTPGSHDLRWDGCDRNGSMVASGIYFIRLDSSTYTMTQKAILLR
jgi:hypothetical protein